jgi:hypothetical protein
VPIAQKIVSFQQLTLGEEATLTRQQNVILSRFNRQSVLEPLEPVLGTAIAGGVSVVFGIISLVGGLLGWLLIMKKKILQCTNCGAVVAAS